jgi:hypothetical protein
VTRVLADDAENVLPLDDAARFTLPLDGCSNFHEFVSFRKWLDLEDKKSPVEPAYSALAPGAQRFVLLLTGSLSVSAGLSRPRITSETSLLGKKGMPDFRIFLRFRCPVLGARLDPV